MAEAALDYIEITAENLVISNQPAAPGDIVPVSAIGADTAQHLIDCGRAQPATEAQAKAQAAKADAKTGAKAARSGARAETKAAQDG